ncbi:hypothetical protein [Rhizobium sp. CSW-27]|nr:hypothetical protein [Rhizobium sp. CSW-27]MBT9373171.1 hypothetical protein [Rhizobium sp. CSW-27]
MELKLIVRKLREAKAIAEKSNNDLMIYLIGVALAEAEDRLLDPGYQS